ncbi:hypothetical protein DFP72DRAFT_856671 [Ephemerocybe angulata]|uniref:Uncharacterized protein n=1 Tax=Ephemerocybe angulata TaxID=980116 RepID=A0A8H6HDY3_9AGAR|nr:hypothetical protein DFP72DRAFT_864452 [Tulosesus angulatus]KAF6743345.1 hypothetical protein DFP72DRAFT_859046 [Tulosesus angulatus]KAF6745284.1 hypothetical protein DFP72DRAFT_856671 [Tulosesus angulatus]
MTRQRWQTRPVAYLVADAAVSATHLSSRGVRVYGQRIYTNGECRVCEYACPDAALVAECECKARVTAEAHTPSVVDSTLAYAASVVVNVSTDGTHRRVPAVHRDHYQGQYGDQGQSGTTSLVAVINATSTCTQGIFGWHKYMSRVADHYSSQTPAVYGTMEGKTVMLRMPNNHRPHDYVYSNFINQALAVAKPMARTPEPLP